MERLAKSDGFRYDALTKRKGFALEVEGEVDYCLQEYLVMRLQSK